MICRAICSCFLLGDRVKEEDNLNDKRPVMGKELSGLFDAEREFADVLWCLFQGVHEFVGFFRIQRCSNGFLLKFAITLIGYLEESVQTSGIRASGLKEEIHRTG